MGSGISAINFVWDRDQKHEIGDHSIGIGDQVYGDTGIIYGIRDQNLSKKWAQGSKLSKIVRRKYTMVQA